MKKIYRILLCVGFLMTPFAIAQGCQWAGAAQEQRVKSQSQMPRPLWVDDPTAGQEVAVEGKHHVVFVEKKLYVTDLSLGLKQAQSAALQRHPGGQILAVYWEQQEDYTVWVLIEDKNATK